MTRLHVAVCSLPRRGCSARTESTRPAIDAIINEAGTAKTTLYKLFGSKTNLVHVGAGDRGQAVARLVHRCDRIRRRQLREETRADFSLSEGLVRPGTFLWLPLHQCRRRTRQGSEQLRAIALRHKKVVLSYIEKLASDMGAAEPAVLAHQLALLMDGAIVAAMVTRDPRVADTAGLVAISLFGPSKLRQPKRAAKAPAELIAV